MHKYCDFHNAATGLWQSMRTVVGVGVAMLMEDFFDSVNRAFTKKVDRIPLPSRPDLKESIGTASTGPQEFVSTCRVRSASSARASFTTGVTLSAFPLTFGANAGPRRSVKSKYATYRRTRLRINHTSRKQYRLLLRIQQANLPNNPTSHATKSSRSNRMAGQHTVKEMYGEAGVRNVANLVILDVPAFEPTP